MESQLSLLKPEEQDPLIESNTIFENSFLCFNLIARVIKQIKEPDYYLELYKNFLKSAYEDNKDCLESALQYMEYAEFKVFLYKLSYFFIRGIQHGVFTKFDRFEKCNVPEFTFRYFVLGYYRTGLTDLQNGGYTFIRTQEPKNSINLNYNINYKNFNLLEAALFLQDRELISIALDLGYTEFERLDFKVPFILKTCDSNYSYDLSLNFSYKDINLENTYHSYIDSLKPKEKKEEQIPTSQHKQDEGIFNILTGEIVKPRNGTYYIDDFRP